MFLNKIDINNYDHLNLGCGLKAHEKWLNVDGSWQVILAKHTIIKKILVISRLLPKSQSKIPWKKNILRWNLTNKLPLSSNRFNAVYSSHTIEHLFYDESIALLRECYRILADGGVLRVVVPDLFELTRKYLSEKEKGNLSAANKFMSDMGCHPQFFQKNILAYYHRLTAFHTHKWMYDMDSLSELFIDAGFSEVQPKRALDSRILRISEVEDPERINNGQGIVVEGIKNANV
ncbi:MAG: methyltransferase domain-containing protein [Deltaproteobacteria bacterium]|nr:methyltransferase domain-containing protein [Deltaproteobacteria bacterium]